MNNKQKIQTIRADLLKNGFYKHLNNQEKLSEKFLCEFNLARAKDNPRNIHFNHSWKEIDSYGEDRILLLIELGGTFLKLFKISVKNNRINLLKSKKINFYRKIIYTPEILFSDLKLRLDFFLNHHEQQTIENCIFIFTFPLKQYKRKDGIIDGICTNFAKQHRSKGIVGLAIGENLQKYLNQNGYPLLKIGVTNDSPPSLLAAKKIEIENKEENFDAIINIIVGTGSNIAVGYNLNNNFFISNTEFGLFTSFPQSVYDKRMDKKTTSKGTYLTEKMFSGAWRDEVFKEILKSLIKKKVIDKKLKQKYKISKLDSKGLDELLDKRMIKSHELYPLKFIWQEISKRGGYICGFALANIILELQKDKQDMNFGIIEVGGVIEFSKNFNNTMIQTMNLFIEKNFCSTNAPRKITISLFNPKMQTIYGSTIFDAFLH
ncbi:hypothetical protein GF376_02325 [Candidatus Peregrinibacteria bacterium]|nr:hypothetical protein [Candidatus Peregrinibacteria bacterium]